MNRRTVLSALGGLLPTAFAARGATAAPPGLSFRSFEQGLRAALADGRTLVRVEVGYSDLFAGGVQGCYNDRPFAGRPAGGLRIVRAGSEPGPPVGGVRLYVCAVEVAVASSGEGRPLDFASLAPAPVLGVTDAAPSVSR